MGWLDHLKGKKEIINDLDNPNISEEKKQKIRELNRLNDSLAVAKQTLKNAIRDLDGQTVEDAQRLFEQGIIDLEQKEEFINAIEVLETLISMHPRTIKILENSIARLSKEISEME